ncbi:hypothetical protein CsSME_00001462 [Camellia sinensis var. sinensis]
MVDGDLLQIRRTIGDEALVGDMDVLGEDVNDAMENLPCVDRMIKEVDLGIWYGSHESSDESSGPDEEVEVCNEEERVEAFDPNINWLFHEEEATFSSYNEHIVGFEGEEVFVICEKLSASRSSTSDNLNPHAINMENQRTDLPMEVSTNHRLAMNNVLGNGGDESGRWLRKMSTMGRSLGLGVWGLHLGGNSHRSSGHRKGMRELRNLENGINYEGGVKETRGGVGLGIGVTRKVADRGLWPNRPSSCQEWWEELAGLFGLCFPNWLDRFLHTLGWAELFPDIRQEVGLGVMSTIVYFKDWWESGRVHGWEGFKFMRKLRGVEDNFKVWKHEVFGDLNEVKVESVWDIEELDAKESGEGLSGVSRDKRSLLRMKLEELVFREQIFGGQRAKLKWAKEGIEGINWAPVESATTSLLDRPFDECENIVKGDLMRVFGEFFKSGELNLCTNASFICLIPKKEKLLGYVTLPNSSKGAF